MFGWRYLLHLVGLRSDDQREQLVPETNTENWLGVVHTDHLPHVVDGVLTELRIPRAVTDEQTIKIYEKRRGKSAMLTTDEGNVSHCQYI